MKLIDNNNLTLISKGKTYKVNSQNPLFSKAYKLLVAGNESAFIEIASGAPEAILLKGKKGFVDDGTKLTYKGYEITGALKTKVLSILKEELPLGPFEAFVDRLLANPSQKAVQELFDFLDYKELAITSDGMFIAYKGVESNYWSKTGNKETKVLKGRVDAMGRIYNGLGEEIEVDRKSVDDDRARHCSSGLHAGSLAYARTFAPKLVLVVIDPADVICVPNDCQCQKLRTCRYKVVSDCKEELVSPIAKVDKKSGKVTQAPSKRVDDTKNIERIRKYIANKSIAGEEWVSYKGISNAFSPDYITNANVKRILGSLGYKESTDYPGWVEI